MEDFILRKITIWILIDAEEDASDIDVPLFDSDTEGEFNVTPAEAALLAGYRLFGDVNDDEEIDINDILKINSFRLGRQTPTEEETELGDLNRNGELDLEDIEILNRYRLKKDTDASAVMATGDASLSPFSSSRMLMTTISIFDSVRISLQTILMPSPRNLIFRRFVRSIPCL